MYVPDACRVLDCVDPDLARPEIMRERVDASVRHWLESTTRNETSEASRERKTKTGKELKSVIRSKGKGPGGDQEGYWRHCRNSQ